MRIVFENRIMSNVLFELMNGTKIWYTDMNFIQRGHADKLLAAQQSFAPDSLKAGDSCLPESVESENALPAQGGG